jgi:hypothetical protein
LFEGYSQNFCPEAAAGSQSKPQTGRRALALKAGQYARKCPVLYKYNMVNFCHHVAGKQFLKYYASLMEKWLLSSW